MASEEPDVGREPQLAPSAEALEAAIRSVPGVAAAEVARASGRDRLRISLLAGEDPEAVAWTVAAVLRERFAISLDPAAISARTSVDGQADAIRVIQRIDPSPPTDEVAAPPLDAADRLVSTVTDAADAADAADGAGVGGSQALVRRRPRPVITELDARVDGLDLVVTATLRLGGRVGTGQARGLRTRRGRWRAVSEATIDALGPLTDARLRAHVDHVTILSYTELAHVSVSVTLLTDRGEETFLGAALIRDDPDRAVMRATLDAVNRRVEPLLEPEGLPVPEAG